MWLPGTRELFAPTVVDLPRITDRVSFLFIDGFRVQQDETGVVAVSAERMVRIPIASTLVLMLGPGTSISTPAVLTLTRHGTTIQWCGVNGIGVSSTAVPLTSKSSMARTQALAYADPVVRVSVARAMYEHRFGEDEVPEGATIAQMRGMEGQRVKATYERLTRIHGLSGWTRRHHAAKDEMLDPVNIALNVANGMLYSIASAVIGALGMSPALGFIHSGNHRSFALDLADLYKTDTSFVVAFACSDAPRPERAARRAMRDYIVDLRLHAAMVKTIQALLPAPEDIDEGALVDDAGYIDGGGWNQG